MTRTRTIGACVAAAVAACAVGAGSAAAAPPEFSPPYPNPFTSTSKATVLETVGKKRLTCKADTNKGEITGPSTALVKISFTGCTSPAAPGVPCQSPNGAPGEIVTEQLLGMPGYIRLEPTKEVGVDLSNPTGGPMFAFFCGAAVSGEVRGSVIGKITPINKLIKPGSHAVLKFAQKAGHQIPMMFLGGPIDVPLTKFGAGPLEESGLSSIDILTFAAPVTIIA
jgi:hypothetical protein